MTKQEEIREGIAELYWDTLRLTDYVGLDYKKLRYSELWDGDFKLTCQNFADKILKQEASQGVVIKVEKRLVDIGIDTFESSVAKMLKAGYVAVGPLTKEGK